MTSPHPSPLRFRRLLLTGAAGGLGRVLRPRLKARCDVLRVSDVAELGTAAPGEELQPARLEDRAAMRALLEGVEAVVHLGGVSTEQPFEAVLGPNLRGLYHVYEAARRAWIPRSRKWSHREAIATRCFFDHACHPRIATQHCHWRQILPLRMPCWRMELACSVSWQGQTNARSAACAILQRLLDCHGRPMRPSRNSKGHCRQAIQSTRHSCWPSDGLAMALPMPPTPMVWCPGMRALLQLMPTRRHRFGVLPIAMWFVRLSPLQMAAQSRRLSPKPFPGCRESWHGQAIWMDRLNAQ